MVSLLIIMLRILNIPAGSPHITNDCAANSAGTRMDGDLMQKEKSLSLLLSFIILLLAGNGKPAWAGGGDPNQPQTAYCIVDDTLVDEVGITCTNVTPRGVFVSHETEVPAWEVEQPLQIFVSETYVDVCSPNDDLGFGMPVASAIYWGDDSSSRSLYPIEMDYTPTTTVLYAGIVFNDDRNVEISQQMNWPVELLPASHNRPRGPYTVCLDGYPAIRVLRTPSTTWMQFELSYVDYDDM